ncbi:MAG: hypothetical protein WC858_00865 [Parcubacteria group bacterium]|jgi:hypothetical protein
MEKKSLEGFPEQFKQNIEDVDQQRHEYEEEMTATRFDAEKDAAVLAELANELAKREGGDVDKKIEAMDILKTEAEKMDGWREQDYSRKVDDLISQIGLKKQQPFQVEKGGKEVYGDVYYQWPNNSSSLSSAIEKVRKDIPKLFENAWVIERFVERTKKFEILRYIPEKLRHDKTFLHGMIKKQGIEALKYLPYGVKNVNFLLEVVNKNPNLKLADLKENIPGEIYSVLEKNLKTKSD